MVKTGRTMGKYGLVGKNISYSFSKGHFARKFARLGLEGYSYDNFDLQQIGDLPDILKQHPDLKGLNVTIPYKEAVIPYLDEIDPEAAAIGAVNTIQFNRGRLKGYNTDVYGFRKSLEPLLEPHHQKALVLGTGGASKAVAHVLRDLGIAFNYVSRRPGEGQFAYTDLGGTDMGEYSVIINTTPLGTWPAVEEKPALPYDQIGPAHLLFDLIYNPEKTAFLLAGESRGARIQNGLEMLEFQAEKAWDIWNP
jgi:shikimate dehydrogenase